jgi:arginase
VSTLHILGVPSSAGSYALGQEEAPGALRAAGLVEALERAGTTVHDAGDLSHHSWSPDRENRYAQNLDEAVASVRELAAAVPAVVTGDSRLLVLGGNCLIALGVCAGLREAGAIPHLVYVDRHFDLNTPETTNEGALDWMGVAHALGLPGTAAALADAFGPRPLLTPGHVAFLGVDPAAATEWERRQVEELQLPVVTLHELAAAPATAARTVLAGLADDPFVVHVDVDVLDFIDAPIAENVNGRNTGPTIEQLGEALTELLGRPGCRAVSIGELNPVHARADPAAIPRFIEALAGALSAR